jgi:hypothetical protein
MRLGILATTAALLVPLAGAHAGFPVSQEMTCPIGGERFTFTTTGSYTIFGYRPDGKPYGSWTFPLDLPECPSNRLIVYKDFSPEELARLPDLLARPEYRALGDEAQYYRLHWLLREMGAPGPDYLWALVQAGWQAEPGSARRNLYLEEFAGLMAAETGEPQSLVDFAMRGRWTNALRELGRFEEAAALLARTSLDPLRQATEDEDERRNRESWIGYFEMLGRLIERRDPGAEPLEGIPDNVAFAYCVDQPDRLTEWDRAFCEAHPQEVERLRGYRTGG